MGKYWADQEKRYIHPFRICGNVYYVGDDWVCVHLIDTGDGLLLIDSGNCGATAMLVQAIWEIGFRPDDVRWMILSHGHVDHIGGANFFRHMFGTKLYLGAPDAENFEKRPELSAIQDGTNCMDHLFDPDVRIQDGDIIVFGKTRIRFYMVPGHTAGCIACFFDIPDGNKILKAGYFGGFGFNTMSKEYLLEAGDTSYHMREEFLDSLAKVRDEQVDVFLGNHTVNNGLLEKRQYQIEHPGENPFIDSTLWGRYLDEKREAMEKYMRDPRNL